ncbi:MAG: hypothetical protein HYV60_11755 [Planctomycetia bacterium]|nr:hypothetical protein [Planctomycetia bacterium]
MSDASSYYGSESESADKELLLRLANELREPRKREAAAAKLWELLAERLERRLAFRIAQSLQGKVSAEDAVQAGLASFLVRRAKGQYDFKDSSDVDALIYTICKNKLIDSVRWFKARKRNPRAEVALSSESASSSTGDCSSNSGDSSLPDRGSSILDSEFAEQNNADSGDFAAGRNVAYYPERVRREYNRRDEPSDKPPAELRELPPESADEWLADLLASEDDFVATVVKELIEPLDDDLKTLLRLRFVEGYALKDLPALMNRTLKEVRTKSAAIQEAFQDLYDDSQFGYHALRDRPKESP